MAVAPKLETLLRPSDEIRQAQQLIRSTLLADDLREDPQMLESVTDALDEVQVKLGDIAGQQEMFEGWKKA